MSSLGPGDANALVQLRAMLEQARQSAGASSPVGRLTALVLLDAVNERIIHLAAQTLPGVQVGPKDKFEDMYSKVKAELQSTWTQNSWAEVRQLHRARNAAQHEGIGTDPALLPGFAIATERFTSTLVLAVFAVRIDQVYLADAIADPTIAGRLRAAEEALDRTDVADAMKAVEQAFDDAFKRWLQQHKRAHRRGADLSLSSSLIEFREVAKALDRARDLVVAQSFATDPAEYTWFSHVRGTDPATVTTDEARRALTFVFWWIVRWEAISSSMITENVRRIQWLQHQRQSRVRSSEGPARLEGVTMRPFHIDRHVARFGVTDLPPEDTYDEWRIAVSDELQKIRSEGQRFATLNDDDSVTVEVKTNEDPTSLVRALSDALSNAEANVAARIEQGARERDTAEQAARSFAAEFAKSSDQVPAWVSTLYLSNTGEASPGSTPSRLRLVLSEHAAEHWSKVRECLQLHPAIRAVIGTVGGALRIEPELDVPGILRVLHDVDPDISPYLDDERRRLDEEERARTDLLRRLTAALQQLT